jgi:ribosomal protein S6--L-glutamate ligase
MKLVTIVDKKDKLQSKSSGMLKKACKDRGIKYVEFQPDDINSPLANELRKGKEKFLLYRIARGERSRFFEFSLFVRKATSFYNKPETLLALGDKKTHYAMLGKLGIKIPNTVLFPSRNKKMLTQDVKRLGGFPIIIKMNDTSHGEGLELIKTMAQLIKTMKKLDKNEEEYFLQEYIKSANKHARLVVIGHRTVGGIMYTAQKGSIISNSGTNIIVSAKKFSKKIENLSKKSVRTSGLEFGGVDVTFGKEGNFVLEVNFPCYFPRSQDETGIDIAGMMVDYLLKKSKR